MLNTVEREDFCLLFPTLTLTDGALTQVKRLLGGVTRSGETHCWVGFLWLAPVGGLASFLECFYS